MKYQIIFRKEADLDIQQTILYYAENYNIQTVKSFKKELLQVLDILEQHPQHFQKRHKDFRIINFEKLPFGIHYKLQNNTVIIFRVLHFQRNFL